MTATAHQMPELMAGLAGTTFHVIFVRNTVRLLSLFLHSLRTRTSTVRFCLVSNGCTKAERVFLEQFSQQDDRFDFLELSRAKVMPHGHVLNELFRRARTPLFAFMDSDCFVTADPFVRLIEPLEQNAAVFSGQPVWSRDLPRSLPRDYRCLSDFYDELPDGTCVGNTYFAVYDRCVLSECMQRTGVSFREYSWRDLPSTVQGQLHHADRRLSWYDVGKVLNILLVLGGRRCRYVELPELWHVGAMSSTVVERGRRLRFAAATLGILEPLRRALWSAGLRANPLDGISEPEKRTRLEYSRRRKYLSDRVWSLLRKLEANEAAAERFDDGDRAVATALATLEDLLLALHQERFADGRMAARARLG